MLDNSHRKTKLKNGLSVAVKEINTAPIVSIWIWYKVGSRDEVPGITGASHFLEHMTAIRFYYKNTPFFPLIDKLGGATNAMTSFDYTAYYATVPAYQADTVLQAFAKQMGGKGHNIRFDEADQERKVIISERQGLENEPMFCLSEAVQQAAFRVHPYHHEIIGDMADLHAITRDDLYNHYRTYYIPNNAVLAIAGDFDTKAMLNRVRELFGPIPNGATPPRLSRPEPEQKGEVRLSVEGPGETAFIQIAYRFPQATHPDYFPLQVLDSLLGGASGLSYKTSRLYRALVDKEYAVDVSGWSEATIDPYLYRITITNHPKRKPEESIAALDAEIENIQNVLVSLDEIKRAVKQARAVFAYGSENITNQAFWMGYVSMFAGYEWFETYLDKLALVTPQDVQRVARKYLQAKNRVIGTYIPKGTEA